MREILFKAKSIEYGEWIEGIPIKTHLGLFISFEENPHYCSQYGYMEIDDILMVDEKTLCKFTGLYDKRGNKIWENDILMAHLDDLYPEDTTYETIEWGVAGWVAHEANSIDGQYLDEFDLEYFEVVGNIFDNPELLQEESDE